MVSVMLIAWRCSESVVNWMRKYVRSELSSEIGSPSAFFKNCSFRLWRANAVSCSLEAASCIEWVVAVVVAAHPKSSTLLT